MLFRSWSIGSRGDTSGDGRFFGGTLDEVAIFNTALTQAQIQQIFYSAKMSPIIITAPVPPSGTVYEGSTLNFSVVAAGNPTLLYQWTKNTTPLPGQTGTSLTLKRAENQTETVLRADVDEIVSTGQSLMPEGLEKGITVEEMADLLAFLKNWRYIDGK